MFKNWNVLLVWIYLYDILFYELTFPGDLKRTFQMWQKATTFTGPTDIQTSVTMKFVENCLSVFKS